MGLPRNKYVQEGEIGVYHRFSRCVPHAFLCGFDAAGLSEAEASSVPQEDTPIGPA